MELPRREFLHLAAGRSSARRFSHSSPLLVLALLVLEERKQGEIFQRNYTTVARALDDTRAAARASLGAALNVLICSITGFHSACSVSVRGRDGRGLWPRTWSSRYRNAVGTTHGRRAGDLPRRKREARPDTTRGSPSRRPN